jgi:inosine/xanthosine triphosphatase
MNIALGSMSELKLDAVKEACNLLSLGYDIYGTETNSKQNEQPVGFEETYSGALTRAKAAQSLYPEDIAIGIESGIFRSKVTLDFAVIVVLTPTGQQIVTTSEGVMFPEFFVKIAEEMGFESTTVGSVIADKLNCNSADPHSVVTAGRVSRKTTLANALATALSQL